MSRERTGARLWGRYVRDSRAVTALEYAVLTGVVVTALTVALGAFTGSIETALEKVSAVVTGIDTSAPPAGDESNTE